MTERKITLNDVRAVYPSYKRVAFVCDFFAWIENLDESVHNLSKDIDGTLIRRARPDVSDFDYYVSLHLEAMIGSEEEEEPEEEEPECYWPANPRAEWGTY